MKMRIIFAGTDRPNLFTESDAVPREGDYLHLEGHSAVYLVREVGWRGSAPELEGFGRLYEMCMSVVKAPPEESR